MAIIGDLVTRISADSKPFTRGINNARGDLGGFSNAVGGMVARLSTLVAAYVSVKKAMDALSLGVKFAADAEQAEVAFTTLLGSAKDAKSVLSDVARFAASTPFQLPELRDSARMLAAFGFEAEQIVPNLRMIGDIAAGTGQPVSQLAEIYGKAAVQGRLFGEDINQLTGRGIPIIGQLASQFGVAESEVKKLVEQGKVGFPELQAAFVNMTSQGGRFSGMMDAQSKTLAGVWSTFKDNVNAQLLAVGNTIVRVFDLKNVISSMTTSIQNMATLIGWFSENWRTVFDLAMAYSKLSLTSFASDFVYIFEAQIPGYIRWFFDNWKSVFTTIESFTSAVFVNMAKNIQSIMSEVWNFLKSGGMDGIEVAWTPLTEGFRNAIKELPDIPERSMSALEKKLSADVESMSAKLTQSLALDLKMAEAQANAKSATTLPETEQKKTDPGEGIKEGVAAGSLAGSKEAFDTILASQMAGAREKDKTEAELKKQTTVLQTIARELALPKPDDVIFGGAF